MRTQFILSLCGFVALSASPTLASALLKPSSGATQALAAKSLDINAQIDGAFTRTTLTTIYKNPNSRRIEADFIYSAPVGSVVTGFAYWFGSEKVVARVVEKKRAARIYSYITTRQRDPALVEMIGKNAFRARIFPVEANQDLKIEVQLAQKLDSTRQGFEWNYLLREETKTPLENLKIHLESSDANISANLGAFALGKLDVERKDVENSQDLRVLVPRSPVPLRASLLARRESKNGDGFFALSLASASPVALPRLKISGVSTYDVQAPIVRSLKAFEPFIVFGRYKGGGKAVVALNNQSVALEFGSTVEIGSAAASFWAQKRIETLSESAKNQFEVVNLSKRFGLVSKWTSWLAIPAAERARFQREVDEADRANAGRAYAQAIARGDRKTAANQKKVFAILSKKMGASAPISDFLDSELEMVTRSIENAKNSRQQRKNVAGWQKLQRVLLKNGARRDSNEYATSARAYAEAQALAPLYVAAIENRQVATARRLKKQLVTLANLRAVRRYQRQDAVMRFMAASANSRVEQMAFAIASERAEKRLNLRRERDLMARMKRVSALYGQEYTSLPQVLEKMKTAVVEEKTSKLLSPATRAIKAGTPLAEATRNYNEQWEIWEQRVGGRALTRYSANNAFKAAIESRLADEVRAGRDLDAPNAQLKQELRTFLQKTGDSYSWEVRRAYSERAAEVARQLLDEQLENGAASSRAQSLKNEVSRLAAASGSKGENVSRAAAGKVRGKAKTQIADEVARYAENSPKSRAAQQKLAQLSAINPAYTKRESYSSNYDYWHDGDFDLEKTWRGRAHESAYRLLQAQAETPADAAKIAQLQRNLSAEAAQAEQKPENFLNVEKIRREQGEPLLTAQEYRVRWGDPLISVLAPASCRQFVAIMPDGTLLPLRFDSQKGAWEARFDVPTWATEGDYRVQVLIVSPSGARQKLTMNFALDVSAPSGVGTVQSEVKGGGKTWQLRLESDAQTDRVSAFTPWNERIELRRDAMGVFTAPVAVPAEFRAQKAKIRFVLTDKAHNRTEILVDWN